MCFSLYPPPTEKSERNGQEGANVEVISLLKTDGVLTITQATVDIPVGSAIRKEKTNEWFETVSVLRW